MRSNQITIGDLLLIYCAGWIERERWEEGLGCFIWWGHFFHSCQKLRALIEKFHSERRLYIQWYLYSYSWYVVSSLCMAYTLQQVQIHSIGCVLFLLPTEGLSWNLESPQLSLPDSSCNSLLAPRSLKSTIMCVRIAHSCKKCFFLSFLVCCFCCCFIIIMIMIMTFPTGMVLRSYLAYWLLWVRLLPMFSPACMVVLANLELAMPF